MKKTIIFFTILLVYLSFSSCTEEDIIGLLPDININLVEKQNIPIHVNKTNGNWVEFSNNMNLSIVNNNTKDYLNKIKNIKINKLSYRIINFNGDPNGQVDGSFWADNTVSLNNSFVVNTAANNGTIYTITETAELNRIANALKIGHSISIEYSGQALCDSNAMDFIIEVTIDAKITVDP